MTETTNIQRLSDGSIDFQHYERLGRSLHGQAVRKTSRNVATIPGRTLTRLSGRFLGFRRWCGYPSSRMSSKTL